MSLTNTISPKRLVVSSFGAAGTVRAIGRAIEALEIHLAVSPAAARTLSLETDNFRLNFQKEITDADQRANS